MELLDVLAREMDVWPDDKAHSVGQATDGTLHLNDAEDEFIRHTVTAYSQPADHKCYHGNVTRAQWEAEKMKQAKPAEQENKWIRHRGGKCPVEVGTLVDVRYRDGVIHYGTSALDSCDCEDGNWIHEKDKQSSTAECDIMAYRLHKPEQQPSKEEWMELDKAVSDIGADVYAGPFKTGCAADSIKMDIDFPSGVIHIDGPIKWRDRIREIDTTLETLEEERASLIQRLEDEGFKLVRVGAKVAPKHEAVGMHEWRAGDIVRCIKDYESQFKSGSLYELAHSPIGGRIEVRRDDRGDVNGWTASSFEFHSRP